MAPGATVRMATEVASPQRPPHCHATGRLRAPRRRCTPLNSRGLSWHPHTSKFKIKTYNAIANPGLERFPTWLYDVSPDHEDVRVPLPAPGVGVQSVIVGGPPATKAQRTALAALRPPQAVTSIPRGPPSQEAAILVRSQVLEPSMIPSSCRGIARCV